jgi:uridylate kinase
VTSTLSAETISTGDLNVVKYNRILLKLSGEALAESIADLLSEILNIIETTHPGMSQAEFEVMSTKLTEALLKRRFGLNNETLLFLATEIVELKKKYGTQVSLVVGGGNFWRGAKGEMSGMDRARADHMGMLATIMNAIAFKDILEHLGQRTRVQSAIKMDQICEHAIRDKAIRHLEKDRVVIFAAGTGHPYFTTDTGAVLRAIETQADVLLMGKNDVDGIYNDDPNKNPDAKKYDHILHMDAIKQELKSMDFTAHGLAHDNNLSLIAYDLMVPGNLERIVCGESVGTLVTAA